MKRVCGRHRVRRREGRMEPMPLSRHCTSGEPAARTILHCSFLQDPVFPVETLRVKSAPFLRMHFSKPVIVGYVGTDEGKDRDLMNTQ